ncbi:unnamed protein product [Miscanthus lutarioriparius]|uniref:Disease resistance N-terminal domain-containing protein n=1 Tax=Miscanthus lutarioriparius TaxID=422564 RepID=A0A811QLC8_9POAL|nr:unnamed protein product [Miscanthus lutarioriparius]
MAELAAGAVSSLLNAIRDEARLQGRVRGDIQFIKEEMESMNSFLLHLARTSPPGGEHDEQVRTWMNQVRLLAHDCNNCIDMYLYHGNPDIQRARGGLWSYLWWVPWFLQKMLAQHRAAIQLGELKNRARDVGERRLRYGVEVPGKVTAGKSPAPPGHSLAPGTITPSSSYLPGGDDAAGVDDEQDEDNQLATTTHHHSRREPFQRTPEPSHKKHWMWQRPISISRITTTLGSSLLHIMWLLNHPKSQSKQEGSTGEDKEDRNHTRSQAWQERWEMRYEIRGHIRERENWVKIEKINETITEEMKMMPEVDQMHKEGQSSIQPLGILLHALQLLVAAAESKIESSEEKDKTPQGNGKDENQQGNGNDNSEHVKKKDKALRTLQNYDIDETASKLLQYMQMKNEADKKAEPPANTDLDVTKYKHILSELFPNSKRLQLLAKQQDESTKRESVTTGDSNTSGENQIKEIVHKFTREIIQELLEDTVKKLATGTTTQIKRLLSGYNDLVPSNTDTELTPSLESPSHTCTKIICSVQIPRKIGKMLNMEELHNVHASKTGKELKDIGKLCQLRKLGVAIKGTNDHLTNLFQAIGDLCECLDSLSLTLPIPTGETSSFSAELQKAISSLLNDMPKNLQNLSINGTTQNVEILPLLAKDCDKLAKVTLSNTFLKQENLNILSKSTNLQCMKLGHNAYKDTSLNMKAGEFPMLRYFIVVGSNMNDIMFEHEAPPELEKIVFFSTNINSLCGVYDLPKLQELELNNSSKLLSLFGNAKKKKKTKVTLRDDKLKESDVQILSKRTGLLCLVLSGKSCDKEKLEFNKDDLPNLNFVAINCPDIANISFSKGSAPKLKKIIWSITSMGSISGIKNLPRLMELEIYGEVVTNEVKEAIEVHKNSPDLIHYKPEKQQKTKGNAPAEANVGRLSFFWKHRR